LLAFASSVALGQRRASESFNYDQFKIKPYYFGISLGLNNYDFKLDYSNEFILNDTFRIAETVKGPGFTIGVIGNLKIGEYFDLRSVPTFSFSQRTIQYVRNINNVLDDEKVESVFFEVPFLVRYKSAPFKDKRVFVLTGVKYTYDLQNKSSSRQSQNLVKFSPHDYQFEIGAGVQFFMPYFIFSPQIKYSHGLGNILIYDADFEKARILEKVVSRVFSISFNFEG
jgi:hypothetical protein